ncbi:class I SAM-dependent methyltransferase [Neobacillus mesonae]|nr:class I SAM-dependent methyltransferase [Neobacillus mesonae]
MKQNKYDDSDFFDEYSRMSRSSSGLKAAGEWPVLQKMLPDLRGKKVLDLGCGYGWHCRYARGLGAEYVLGIDISQKMLARARSMTEDEGIEYRHLAIEDIEVSKESFDVVISSLALHYIESYELVCKKVFEALSADGHFVFSVEHPMFTALPGQDFYYDKDGIKLHWPVDDYHHEGLREAIFLGHPVSKYHRSIETYVNELLTAGFRLTRLSELKPTEEMLQNNHTYKEELRRPMFLLISAIKTM